MTQDRYKLRQLILYVSWRMGDADHFGSTKLNKILYRADCAAFRELGNKLTSFKFKKNQQGPTLAAFVPVTEELAGEGLLLWEIRPQGDRDEQRPRVPEEPEMSVFSAQQMEILEREIQEARPLTAKQMSEEEHRTAAWYATKMNETINPEFSFVEDPGTVILLSDAEERWAGLAIERYLSRTGRSADARTRN